MSSYTIKDKKFKILPNNTFFCRISKKRKLEVDNHNFLLFINELGRINQKHLNLKETSLHQIRLEQALGNYLNISYQFQKINEKETQEIQALKDLFSTVLNVEKLKKYRTIADYNGELWNE